MIALQTLSHAMAILGCSYKHITVEFIYVFLFCLVIFSGCNSNQFSTSDYSELRPLKITAEKTDLENYISDIEIVPIIGDSIIFSSISKLLASVSRFYYLSGGVVFSSLQDGTSLMKIGQVGRGPGEYLSIKDFCLNLDQTEIYCLDLDNDIIVFDSNTGKYLRHIKTSVSPEYAKSIIPLNDGGFLLFLPNPPQSDLNRENESFRCLRRFDSKGRMIDRFLNWEDFIIDASFAFPVSLSGSKYVLSIGNGDCYVFNGELHPEKLKLDFERHGIPKHFVFEGTESPWQKISEVFQKDWFKLVSSVYIDNDNIYFHSFGKESSSWNFLINRNSYKGIRWMSVGSNCPPISAVGYYDGFLIFPFDDYGYSKNENDPLKRYVIGNLAAESNERSSTYLIKVKFNV